MTDGKNIKLFIQEYGIHVWMQVKIAVRRQYPSHYSFLKSGRRMNYFDFCTSMYLWLEL